MEGTYRGQTGVASVCPDEMVVRHLKLYLDTITVDEDFEDTNNRQNTNDVQRLNEAI